jgi:hypothetical protein
MPLFVRANGALGLRLLLPAGISMDRLSEERNSAVRTLYVTWRYLARVETYGGFFAALVPV